MSQFARAASRGIHFAKGQIPQRPKAHVINGKLPDDLASRYKAAFILIYQQIPRLLQFDQKEKIRVLLGREDRSHKKGSKADWNSFGGKREKDANGKYIETDCKITALRELHEETRGIFQRYDGDIVRQMNEGKKVYNPNGDYVTFLIRLDSEEEDFPTEFLATPNHIECKQDMLRWFTLSEVRDARATRSFKIEGEDQPIAPVLGCVSYFLNDTNLSLSNEEK
ncbi:hypothetical protein PROFUN_12693 [Planoprotostelium fungivorum]|uniref:Nudix hydrolase domain-containing protein n=1 Tax=Planoprotostelium fungivorum TaxID=1890364 RepID=A0A2P6N6X2_9EUKA|nr:hypothetical protein PROFUN_12693 [Planoprotostelium fungivorum]